MKDKYYDIEKLLYKDAEEIEIDEIFKRNLKKRIMAKEKKNHLSQGSMKAAAIFFILIGLGTTASKITDSVINTDPQGTVNTQLAVVNKSSDFENKGQQRSAQKGLTEFKNMSLNQLLQPSNKVEIKTKEEVAVVEKGMSKTQNVVEKVEPTAEVKNEAPKVEVSKEAAENQTKKEPAAIEKNTIGEVREILASGGSNVQDEKIATTPSALENGMKISVLKEELVTSFPEEYEATLLYKGNKLVPYIKEEVEKTTDLKTINGVIKMVEKHCSVVGIQDEKTGKVFLLHKSEVLNEQVLNATSESDESIVLPSKYSYTNAFWSKEGYKFYIMRKSNETGKIDIVQMFLEIQ